VNHNHSQFIEKIGAVLFPYRGTIWGVFIFFGFILAQVKVTFFFTGLTIIIIGELLRIWGVGYIKNYRGAMVEVVNLTTSGPYSYVRNPLYLANGLIGFGIWFLSGITFIAPIYTLLFFFLYHPIICAEEQFLTNKFGKQYLEYLQKVPRYLPTFSPYLKKSGSFSWDVILIKEIHTIATLFILIFLFYLRGFGFLRTLDRLFLWF